MLNVAFVLLPRFTLTPFANMVDVLRLSADEGDNSRPIRCRWKVLSATGEPVAASCGVSVSPDGPLASPRGYSHVVVVGGLLRRPHAHDAEVVRFLRDADAEHVTLVGVCTGSFMLAQAGLLTGRRCCVSWYHVPDLQRQFPAVIADSSRLFAVDGRTITCAGGTGALDLAAWLVRDALGAPVAQKSLDILLADRARDPSSGQPRPPIASAGVEDHRLQQAILLMEQSLADPLPVGALAARVGLSRRQLERLFRQHLRCNPHEFGTRLRLEIALWMLRDSRLSVSTIAGECGFADASHFTRRFTRRYGSSPARIRASFDSADPGSAPPAGAVAGAPGEPRVEAAAAGKTASFLPGERRPYRKNQASG